MSIPYAEAAHQRYSHENVSRKVPPNSQENTHAEVRQQKSRRAAYSSRTPTQVLPHKQIPPTLPPPLPPPPKKKKTPSTRALPKSCTRVYSKVYSKIQINLI